MRFYLWGSVVFFSFIFGANTLAAEMRAEAIKKCDLLISHPADPDHVTIGTSRKNADLALAVKVCRAAVAAYPDHARSNYHLGRALYYSEHYDESMPYLKKAAETGYRQAIFVVAYILSLDEFVPGDICEAGRLWLRGVALEHPWSGYHLVEKQLDGRFEGCDFNVTSEDMDWAMGLARRNITVSASRGRVEALAKRYQDGRK